MTTYLIYCFDVFSIFTKFTSTSLVNFVVRFNKFYIWCPHCWLWLWNLLLTENSTGIACCTYFQQFYFVHFHRGYSQPCCTSWLVAFRPSIRCVANPVEGLHQSVNCVNVSKIRIFKQNIYLYFLACHNVLA